MKKEWWRSDIVKSNVKDAAAFGPVSIILVFIASILAFGWFTLIIVTIYTIVYFAIAFMLSQAWRKKNSIADSRDAKERYPAALQHIGAHGDTYHFESEQMHCNRSSVFSICSDRGEKKRGTFCMHCLYELSGNHGITSLVEVYPGLPAQGGKRETILEQELNGTHAAMQRLMKRHAKLVDIQRRVALMQGASPFRISENVLAQEIEPDEEFPLEQKQKKMML